MKSDSWPRVFRTLHLPGGLRAVETSPGAAKLWPLPSGELAIAVSSYAAIGADVQKITKLKCMGVEFFHTDDQIDGTSQADWRAILPAVPNVWPTHLAELNWSGLANAARLKGDARLFLIAGSITSQCRFVAMRLLDLSNLYLRNIMSITKSNEDMSGKIISRGYYSDNLFSSIHAAFFEMATLRDYMAEYIAFAIYADTKCDSLHKLNGKLSKNPATTPLEIEICSIYGQKSGWLWQFSERRNTLAHRMPYDRLSGGGNMHVKSSQVDTGDSFWLLHVPVPEPIAITHKDNFALPSDITAQFKDHVEATKKAAVLPDTLESLFETFRLLMDFGNRLQSTFPYDPEMVTLTDDDIISVQIKNDS